MVILVSEFHIHLSYIKLSFYYITRFIYSSESVTQSFSGRRSVFRVVVNNCVTNTRNNVFTGGDDLPYVHRDFDPTFLTYYL